MKHSVGSVAWYKQASEQLKMFVAICVIRKSYVEVKELERELNSYKR